MHGDWPESPSQEVLYADEIAAVRAVLGAGLPEARVVAAISRCGGNAERAINALLDDATAGVEDKPEPKKGKGAKTAAPPVKAERDAGGAAPKPPPPPVKVEVLDDEPLGSQESNGCSARVKKEREDELLVKAPPPMPDRVKEEDGVAAKRGAATANAAGISLVPRPKKRSRVHDEADTIDLTATHPVPYLNPRPIRAVPPPEAMEMLESRRVRARPPPPSSDLRMVVAPPDAEFGEFPEERDWFLVGRSYVTGLSTNRGRRRLDAGELVHFSFPSLERTYGGIKVSNKKAAALAEIVRFSTNRAGEVCCSCDAIISFLIMLLVMVDLFVRNCINFCYFSLLL